MRGFDLIKSKLPIYNKKPLEGEDLRLTKPAVPGYLKADNKPEIKQEVAKVEDTEKEVPNNWNYSDEEMDLLTKNGIGPERLRAIANMKPLSLEQYYKDNNKQPEYDAKKAKNKRLMAGIADGVSMLGRMWSVGKGAYTGSIDPGKTELAKVLAEDKEEKSKYEKLKQMYDSGLLSAKMQDMQMEMNKYKTDTGNIQSILANKAKQDLSIRQAEQTAKRQADEAVRKQANWEAEQEFKKGQQDSLNKYRNSQLTQQRARDKASVENTKARTEAYVKKSQGANNTKSVPFYFKDGTAIDVPEKVWKANYPVLADMLVEQGVKQPIMWLANTPTAQQVEYFVKQHKDKLDDKAIKWLSEIANETPSEYGGDEFDTEEFLIDLK